MSMRAARTAFAVAAFALVATHATESSALPMYAQRSGRTCGNCHISPTWERPEGFKNPELPKRKCNMSCMACHTNPGGGGLRNASGRYYGQSTLSMLPSQERSYSDAERELFSNETRYDFRTRFSNPIEANAAGHSIPFDYEEVLAGIGSGRTAGKVVAGKPFGSPSAYAFWDGRYGDLNADPLFQMGTDVRVAYWTGSSTFFPMQLDLHASLHPVEHLTLMTTVAARGRVSSTTTFATQEQLPFFARNAFIMVHELPYMMYAKAGYFLPTFGTYIDDHTSFIREYPELDVSTSDDYVLGVEIGAAPNYPHFSLSAFRNTIPYGVPSNADAQAGYGLATSFGWRDLGWSLTGSMMLKRRELLSRGDLDVASVGWGFNPFYYSNRVPLTYMGEVSLGQKQRPVVGSKAQFFAMYHELWWTVFNGASVRFKYDLGNRDLEVSGELESRYSVALDLSPISGITFILQGRLLDTQNAGLDADAFFQLHVWM